MKRILLLSLGFTSISLMSQDLKKEVTKHNADGFGNRPYSVSGKIVSPVIHETQTAPTYTNDRALSELNDSLNADAYPWISGDGLRLYYTKGDSIGHTNIFFTQRNTTADFFGTPVDLPLSIADPLSCWLSHDEKDIYFSDRSHIYYAHRNSSSMNFGVADTLILTVDTFLFKSGMSLNAAQNEMYLYAVDSMFTPRIYKCIRTSPTSFSFASELVLPFTGKHRPGQLAKDDFSYLASATEDPNLYSSIFQYTRAQVIDSFLPSACEEVLGVTDPGFQNGQPSGSDNLEWVVFVRSNGSWEGNELFIAQKVAPVGLHGASVFSQQQLLYPNPAKDILNLKFSNSSMKKINVYSTIGQLVLSTESNEDHARFSVKDLSIGLYIVEVVEGSKLNVLKFVKE